MTLLFQDKIVLLYCVQRGTKNYIINIKTQNNED